MPINATIEMKHLLKKLNEMLEKSRIIVKESEAVFLELDRMRATSPCLSHITAKALLVNAKAISNDLKLSMLVWKLEKITKGEI